MAKKQSRHKRSKGQNNIVLQARDINIIKSVYGYRYLTRAQIQRLFGMKCVTRANIRLRKLYDNGYLDRYYQPTTIGSSQAIYTLGLKGIGIIVKSKSIDAETVKKRRRLDKILKNQSIEHNLKLNDFHVNLEQLCNANSQFRLHNWLDARDCECRYKYWNNGKEVKTSLKPDGYFELLYRKTIYSFFVELDMSTSNHAKLKTKFKSYVTFRDKKIHRQVFGRDSFYVLFITNSSVRLLNLHKIASKINPDLFWFTDFEGIEKNLFFDEIWMRSGKVEPRSFFQTPKVKLVS